MKRFIRVLRLEESWPYLLALYVLLIAGVMAHLFPLDPSGSPDEETDDILSVLRGQAEIAAATIATSGNIVLRVRPDGTVAAWNNTNAGHSSYFPRGELSEWRDIIAVAAGGAHAVGLRSDGTVVAAGFNSFGQTNVSHWQDIVAIDAAGSITIGVRADGSVVSAGGYNNERTVPLTRRDDIAAVSTSTSHTVFLHRDGTVSATGESFNNQTRVNDWRDIVAVSAGFLATAGLRADGTVVVTQPFGSAGGSYRTEPFDVSDWDGIIAISMDYGHILGLRYDGTLLVAGAGDYCYDGWVDPGRNHFAAASAGFPYGVWLHEDGAATITTFTIDMRIIHEAMGLFKMYVADLQTFTFPD